jgi:dihydroxyacid dehydratase/phosphogluconate dehydratase
LTQDDLDRVGASVPLLVDLQPSGRFLMEDFHRAGGAKRRAGPARSDRVDHH